mmetsp:Transcript_20516/g.38156  ORF Transcript_20516/g.38156 Transcript_20516/m.38156 type:complete len:464 (-) Transcript_20516:139-1530(-)
MAAPAKGALRVCIVGSGPGGMYAAKYLLKSALADRVHVDVVDALPMCYGLVRYGVAPDHPEVKSVTNDFDEVMRDPRVSFWGNVLVGQDVTVDALRKSYDGVVIAHGASTDRELGIPGEDKASNVWGARDFVNWYNGHPDMMDRQPPLLDCENAVILGQGNVALDCARILTKDIDELAKTDISKVALEMLSESKLRNVSVLGRRGAQQAAYTIKELRELTKLANTNCVVDPVELEKGMTPASAEELTTRARKRLFDLTLKQSKVAPKWPEGQNVFLRYLVSPLSFGVDNNGRVSSVDIQANKLDGVANEQRAVPDLDVPLETLDCGLVIRSIGYKSEPLKGITFDGARHTVAHEQGRVTGLPGFYTSGWVKRGPSGIIGTNIICARETVQQIVDDFNAVEEPKDPTVSFLDLVSQDKRPHVTDWADYEKLNAEEVRRGEASSPPKPRDKILTRQEMLQIVGKA